MRIGIDAMGGDYAPEAVVRGALAARDFLPEGDKVVLVGDEAAIREHLDEGGVLPDFLEIVHADERIGMDETPVEALRAKPNSSIAMVAQLHADRKLDACISAGNTGAFVAAAQMRLRRLQGVHRPGIITVTPTFHGPLAICDVGANVNCRPQHLYQYGLMASVYLRATCGTANPRVALLSIGEEEAKGNSLVKEARELMKADPNLNFLGNIEGRDLFADVCDVLVCEGFVGNVVIKLIEGMAQAVLRGIVSELAAGAPQVAGAIKEISDRVCSKYDFNEYGGAPLVGVGGVCLICHGASDWRGIMNAVKGARDLVEQQVNRQITKLLSIDERTVHA